jgi:hypothetical protein
MTYLASDTFALTYYSLVDHEQHKDETLLAWAQKAQHYILKKFHGGSNAVHELSVSKTRLSYWQVYKNI